MPGFPLAFPCSEKFRVFLFEFDVESIFPVYKIYLREYSELLNKRLRKLSEILGVHFVKFFIAFVQKNANIDALSIMSNLKPKVKVSYLLLHLIFKRYWALYELKI